MSSFTDNHGVGVDICLWFAHSCAPLLAIASIAVTKPRGALTIVHQQLLPATSRRCPPQHGASDVLILETRGSRAGAADKRGRGAVAAGY
jgi:hypothetical protein